MDRRTTTQDDWVRQARELSITSPLSVTVGFSSEPEAGHTLTHSRVDEHMVRPPSGMCVDAVRERY